VDLLFLETVMLEQERLLMTDINILRTINITCPAYSLIDFTINMKQKQELIDIGKEAVENHLNKN